MMQEVNRLKKHFEDLDVKEKSLIYTNKKSEK
jgi:hypothetical protein